MRKSFRIPKVIHLPGWPIKVSLVDTEELHRRMNDDDEIDGGFTYDDNGGEILILKSLPITQQRTCLAHELQHAVVDYLDVLLRSNSARLP